MDDQWKGHKVQALCDNTAAVGAINARVNMRHCILENRPFLHISYSEK